MIFKITYKVGGMEFSARAQNIAQAYEYIQSIIKVNSLSFPNQENILSEYMSILARLQDGKLLKAENHFFRIEADRSDKRIQRLTEALIDADKTIGKMYGACGAYCDNLIESYWDRKKEREKWWEGGGIAK